MKHKGFIFLDMYIMTALFLVLIVLMIYTTWEHMRSTEKKRKKAIEMFVAGEKIVCFINDKKGYDVSSKLSWSLTDGYFVKCDKNGTCIRLHPSNCFNRESKNK